MIEYKLLNKNKNKAIFIVDTPGVDPVSKNSYDKKNLKYLKLNIQKNSTILFIVDISHTDENEFPRVFKHSKKL